MEVQNSTVTIQYEFENIVVYLEEILNTDEIFSLKL